MPPRRAVPPAEEVERLSAWDTHVHMWPRGLTHPDQLRLGAVPASPRDLLTILDSANVDVAVASPSAAHPNNGYVLGAAGALPDRIIAVVGADPHVAADVGSIRSHAAHGAAGVRLKVGLGSAARPVHLPGLDSIVDEAVEAGLVVQWTIPLPLVGLVEHAAARQPRAVQVVDHLALPADVHDLRGIAQIRNLASIPGLFIKLSGLYVLSRANYPYEDTWPWVEAVVEAFGADRTMWGSDWPASLGSASYAAQLDLVGLLPFLDRTAQRQVLRETAAHVWSKRRSPAIVDQ